MYRMYLGINDGQEGFILPVLPEKIEISEAGNNKTYDIINLGEVNILNLPKLTEISFESFFPYQNGPYVSSVLLFEPNFYINKIREWRLKKQKIRFIFTGGPLEINDLFSIENFKVTEEGGEVGDLHYSIDLKRYKHFEAKKVVILPDLSKETNTAVNTVVSTEVTRPVEKQSEKTHTVVSGDTLFLIAKRYLGNGTRWREIYNLNKGIIAIPEKIYPGQVFKLP